MHESILVYRRFRFLKWALLLMLVAVVAYAVDQPLGAPNGGTWLGYTLGTIGALMIVWLTWFGVRKRRYNLGPTKLEAWLSAHVYLGLALIIVATLHTGFQFGWNVHTLAYTLMMLVIISGIFGVYAYMRYPALMTENRRGQTLTELLAQIADIDAECRQAALGLGDEVSSAVLNAAQNTVIGGGMRRQLSGHDPSCATTAARLTVQGLAEGAEAGQAESTRRLISLLLRKEELLRRARRDVQFKALMDIWLYLHVPLTIGLIASLVAHIVSVFFYW